jgi:hypothetical protein
MLLSYPPIIHELNSQIKSHDDSAIIELKDNACRQNAFALIKKAADNGRLSS